MCLVIVQRVEAYLEEPASSFFIFKKTHEVGELNAGAGPRKESKKKKKKIETKTVSQPLRA